MNETFSQPSRNPHRLRGTEQCTNEHTKSWRYCDRSVCGDKHGRERSLGRKANGSELSLCLSSILRRCVGQVDKRKGANARDTYASHTQRSSSR